MAVSILTIVIILNCCAACDAIRAEYAPRLPTLRKTIIDRCRLNEKSRPVVHENESMTADIQMVANSFQSIDEGQQTFSIIADIRMTWSNPCTVWNDSLEWQDVDTFGLPMQEIWTPYMLHTNSISDVVLQSVASNSVIDLYNDGSFEWVVTTRFTSMCELNFDEFPFDQQMCTVEFESYYSTKVISVTLPEGQDIEINRETFISPNAVWLLARTNASMWFKVYSTYSSKNYSHISFGFTLLRRYEIYVTSIFLPSFSLVIMQLFSAFIPPDDSNRAVFCITVVLAYFVVLAAINQLTPTSSQTPYIVILLMCQQLCGVISSLYSLVACALGRRDTFKVLIKLKPIYSYKPTISLIRLIDLLFYLVIIVIMLAANVALFSFMLRKRQ